METRLVVGMRCKNTQTRYTWCWSFVDDLSIKASELILSDSDTVLKSICFWNSTYLYAFLQQKTFSLNCDENLNHWSQRQIWVGIINTKVLYKIRPLILVFYIKLELGRICDQMHAFVTKCMSVSTERGILKLFILWKIRRWNKETAVMTETHTQMVQIQFVKQPLIMVNFSWKGLKTVVIRELVMAAILFFKMNDKVFKSKHYELIVHCKPLKPILSELETFLGKKTDVGHGNCSKKALHRIVFAAEGQK